MYSNFPYNNPNKNVQALLFRHHVRKMESGEENEKYLKFP